MQYSDASPNRDRCMSSVVEKYDWSVVAYAREERGIASLI